MIFRWLRLLSSRTAQSGRSAGLKALARGEYESAEALLTASIASAQAPEDRAFYCNKRGVARVRLGRRDDARADFEQALAAVDRYAPALANLGNLLFEEDRIDEAIAAYRAAIDADAGHKIAYANLSAALKRAGRFDEAVRTMREAQRPQARKGPRMRL